jgi:spore coat polysaccharide biosynthesis protein SpsF
MRVFCISQARIGSTRLPGKVLKTINGKSLLLYHVERIRQSSLIDCHIIATSVLTADIAIVEFCQQQQINYFCGDEEHVLSRFYHAAKAFDAQPNDIIVRVTSDCPLIAPELIDRAIQKQQDNNNIGVTHVDITSYPRGFDTEVFSMAALTCAYNNATTAFQHEHVTPYLYQNPKQFPLNTIKGSSSSTSSLRLCVDEQSDFDLIQQLVLRYPGDITNASASELIAFLQYHPELVAINHHVQQKSH